MSGAGGTPDSNLSVPEHISLSLFDKTNCFQLLPCSLTDFSRQLYPELMFLVSLVCLEQAGHSAFSVTHLSLCRHRSPFNKINWFQLPPCSFQGFSSELYLKLHVQGRPVFVPALPIMSCVPTYRTPSSHDITGGDITQAGSHHRRVVVVGGGGHGSGMSVTQGAGTAIWLANCFVPDIYENTSRGPFQTMTS